MFDQMSWGKRMSCRYTSALTSERTLVHRSIERPWIRSGVPGQGPRWPSSIPLVTQLAAEGWQGPLTSQCLLFCTASQATISPAGNGQGSDQKAQRSKVGLLKKQVVDRDLLTMWMACTRKLCACLLCETGHQLCWEHTPPKEEGEDTARRKAWMSGVASNLIFAKSQQHPCQHRPDDDLYLTAPLDSPQHHIPLHPLFCLSILLFCLPLAQTHSLN